MQELDFASAFNTNWIKLGPCEMQAHADRVIVVEDEFHFGTECTFCGAKDIRMIDQMHQASVIGCSDCAGKGLLPKAGNPGILVRCQSCEGKGWTPCPMCKGTGVEGGVGVAHPQDREQRPTTGVIVSKGFQANKFELGESVLYPSFAGHYLDLTAQTPDGREFSVSLCILHEHEILCHVKGHLELRRVNKSTAYHTAA